MMIGKRKEEYASFYCTILEKAQRPVIRKHKTVRDSNLGCSKHNAIFNLSTGACTPVALPFSNRQNKALQLNSLGQN